MKSITVNLELTEAEAYVLERMHRSLEEHVTYWDGTEARHDLIEARAGTKLARAIRKAQENK